MPKRSTTVGTMVASGRARAWGHSLGWALLAGILSISNARADPPVDVLVVPVVRDDGQLESLRGLALAVAEELEQLHIPHLSMKQAGEVFARVHSGSPGIESPDALERLRTEAQKALDAVTNADWPLALKRLMRAMEIGGSALEPTNRNERAAQQLFQACLLTLQLMAEGQDLTAAREQAIACAVQSPGMELPEKRSDYAPIVRELLAEGKRSLAAERAGPIEITSAPAGCVVRVNGRPVGSTPFTFEHPGRHPYRVQVECSAEAGRVHEVVPGEQATRLMIDSTFERALRTDHLGLSLSLANASGAAGRDHVRSLLRILSAKHALVLSRSPNGRFVLQRVGEGSANAVFLDDGFTPDKLRQSIVALLEPFPHTDETEDEDARAASRHDEGARRASVGIWQKALVAGAVVTGGAALGLGYALHRRQVLAGDTFEGTDPGSAALSARGRAWDKKRVPPFAWTSIGAAAVTAGAVGPLIATGRKFPWWTTTIVGAVGTGLVAWGIADLVGGDRCGTGGSPIEASCVDEQDRRDRGGIVLLTSVPLLSIAGLQVARALAPSIGAVSEAVMSPRIGRQHVGFEVTRRF